MPAVAAIRGAVLVDGAAIDLSDETPRDAPSHRFELYLGNSSRYLSLAMLNGAESTHYDDTTFRDVRLALVEGDVALSRPISKAPESVEEAEVMTGLATALPRTVTLPYPIADRGLLNGQYGGFLGAEFDPAFVRPLGARPYKGISPSSGHVDLQLAPDVSKSRFARRRELLAGLESSSAALPKIDETLGLGLYRSKALDMLSTPEVRSAFDVRREPKKLREAYGSHICGRSALLARRLTEAGVPLVTVYCSVGDLNGAQGDNWDTHGNNFARLRNDLLPPLEQASAALLDDLADRGRWDETLVVFLTEFGRTPKINGSAGRDHFPNCYSVAFAGGGIEGGQIYGSSDKTGSRPAAQACSPEDIHATILHALGIDPQFTIHDLDGRPLPLTDGAPLALF